MNDNSMKAGNSGYCKQCGGWIAPTNQSYCYGGPICRCGPTQTKQAGDVKRYDGEFVGNYMVEREDGKYVRYDSIAHLLKPQERDRCKHGACVACLNGHDLTGYVKCGHCFEKLEGENRRLTKTITDIRELQFGLCTLLNSGAILNSKHLVPVVDWCDKALNSGGVE